MAGAAVRWLRGPWDWLAGTWPVLVVAVVASSVWWALRPLSWRRPVRDEFWRFAALAGIGSLRPIVIAAALVGIGLVGQAIILLDAVGQREAVLTTLLTFLIREATPIVVGLVTLGRAGLINLDELGAMRSAGTVRTLEAQGLDPLLLFVMPRTLALGLCTFAHAVVFLAVSVMVGNITAQVLGVAVDDLASTARHTLRVMGEVGVFVLPVKTLLIGFAIAATTSVSALMVADRRVDLDLMPRGFFRALFALFTVSLLGSVVL